ncbi:receptor-like protein kinase FERONIA [Castanea sativa]|uniref:receptor-like protein kinase FERONIA n=1 Tax=Castanea sativa TaxID=21020 RepID=UPI003F65423A
METSDWLKNEVLLLCQLHHPNLIRLIGYCIEDNDQEFLIYEFMVNGNLGNHLYGSNHHEPLPWKQRLKICIGVARGLHYLHTGVKHTIIHRNVKTQKILLDEKLEPKLSDFGLSKKGPSSLSKALIRLESRVVGTSVYLDPEYCMSGELTNKSDVYSFGAVLLEVLCARKVRNSKLEVEEAIHLIRWASKCKREGAINEIIDPYLMGKIAPECFMVYVDIATSCVRNRGERLPTMGEVQVCLEHALELQDRADAAAAAAGDCNYCVDEYTCNASSGDASPIDTVWETASESTASAEELSLETAMPNGQI